MTHQAGATGSNGDALDIWHVKLANGETRALTLDQLDAAFQEGSIDERTPVLPAGAIRWSTLGEAAGLDETPPPVPSMPNSIAPLAFDTTALDMRIAPPFDASVALDADGDADVEAFRPRRGRKIFGALTAMIVVAGLGFAAFRAKPALQHALASGGGGGTTTTSTTPNAETKAIDPPAPLVAPPPATTQAQPTSTNALPYPLASAAPTVADKKAAAEAEKKAAAEARRAKRAPQKRAK